MENIHWNSDIFKKLGYIYFFDYPDMRRQRGYSVEWTLFFFLAWINITQRKQEVWILRERWWRQWLTQWIWKISNGKLIENILQSWLHFFSLHFSLAEHSLFSIPTILLKPEIIRVLVVQSCLTLCDSSDCNPPGSFVLGVFQARILEWVAITFFRESSQPGDWTSDPCIVGRFFTVWATREVPKNKANKSNPQNNISMITGIEII